MEMTTLFSNSNSTSSISSNTTTQDGGGDYDNNYYSDMRSTKSYIGKIRKTFRMRSGRHIVALRQFQIALQQQERINQRQQAATVAPPVLVNATSNSFNFDNILKLIVPLLQNYIPMGSSSNTTTNNSTSADCQQLILAALIEMRNSISSNSSSSSSTNVTPSTQPPSIPLSSSSTNTTNNQSLNNSTTTTSTTNSPCQCIHCQLQLYIKATVTKVFENLLLAKELKEHRTAHTMTCQEKEIISKDLLESEEFSERIRLFQSLNNSSLIQVESIVRNNMELLVMISNAIPQQRSVYIASFDLPTTNK
ncbi:predicted protein [Naegleria gruberi]|uniref:Predicted protein n=1 Tax=Naegleria gruberi TaxID=5762 RepID=D2VJ68_NAEGR|nr:uncharacterized protein NAEGRDRAFT_68928 [Naegleria gruberi]EFC43226.1 predicted protein [Naegleria gruberi]|eukprot:XP_002675970.1 predicted protein [Naegleria gruberi strain NEG-M]